MRIAAHPIPGRITGHDTKKVKASIKYAPIYAGKAASAISTVIRVIHGLQKLHRRLKITEIEVYLGKANRSAGAVLRRWMFHRSDRKKKHLFGIVLFRCSLKNAKKLEKLGIRVLDRLKARGKLCVGQANISHGSGGRNARSSKSLVYMTWCPLNSSTSFTKPNIRDIRGVAGEIAPQLKGQVKLAQIVNGLKTVKSLNKRRTLYMNYY
jgi:hypothetical protein